MVNPRLCKLNRQLVRDSVLYALALVTMFILAKLQKIPGLIYVSLLAMIALPKVMRAREYSRTHRQ